MLLLHIIIALSSIGVTGVAFLNPSKAKLNIGYFFVALTLITGVYLMIVGHANLIRTCVTGLIYLGFVTVGLVSAHKKLAEENN